MATAEFVRGRSHECMSLSTDLSRLHILPPHPPSAPLPTPTPQTHTDAHALTGAPIAQMTLLIMYLRYLAPVKTALG